MLRILNVLFYNTFFDFVILLGHIGNLHSFWYILVINCLVVAIGI